MKLSKNQTYQAPRVTHAYLEAEGIFCQSIVVNAEVDALQNMSKGISDTDEESAYYFDF